MFQIRDVKFLLEAVGIMSWWEYCWSIGLEIDFSHAWCTPHCVHCQFLSGDGKFLLEGVGTELVQIPLINGIVDSFVRHALCALSVIFRDNLSWNFDLVQILFIEYVKCLSTLVTERFKKWQMCWISWFWDGFVRHCQRNWILINLNEQHKWNFFRDGNLLLWVVGMFSWFKYSGCIGLLTQNTKKWQIVINKKRKKSTGCFFLVLL